MDLHDTVIYVVFICRLKHSKEDVWFKPSGTKEFLSWAKKINSFGSKRMRVEWVWEPKGPLGKGCILNSTLFYRSPSRDYAANSLPWCGQGMSHSTSWKKKTQKELPPQQQKKEVGKKWRKVHESRGYSKLRRRKSWQKKVVTRKACASE